MSIDAVIGIWILGALTALMLAVPIFEPLDLPKEEVIPLVVAFVVLWPLVLAMAILVYVPYGFYILGRYSLPSVCRKAAAAWAKAETRRRSGA